MVMGRDSYLGGDSMGWVNKAVDPIILGFEIFEAPHHLFEGQVVLRPASIMMVSLLAGGPTTLFYHDGVLTGNAAKGGVDLVTNESVMQGVVQSCCED